MGHRWGRHLPLPPQAPPALRAAPAPRTESAPAIAVVDVPDSDHGRLMGRCARLGAFAPPIRWIEPSLRLPEALASLGGIAAVAVPLAVRGATPDDRFTRRLMEAIGALMARGVPVFVAAGNRAPNLLARAGIAVTADAFPGSAGTSEACVRAAVQAAYRSTRTADSPHGAHASPRDLSNHGDLGSPR